ncbi:hypothetical protein FGO68_gene3344 [Halteria grandinella]|uniref:Uncharacterized protein n=1 Tax=Halteria grandinella TaxID=5974 RepID=A0A8J8T083_HALGN|nr:hypothetical protein FGO68_gene3344 [Halteria grandinella]
MKLVLVVIFAVVVQGLRIGNTLDDCKEAALAFQSTCPSAPDTPATWSNTSSLNATALKCPSTSCPGQDHCDLMHALCVTCYEQDSKVYMRLQTTSLPNRCIGGKGSDYRLMDFSIEFNPSVDGAERRIFASQEEYEGQACKVGKAHDSQVEERIVAHKIADMYSQYLEDFVGVAIDGVLIKASTNDQGVDPLFPNGLEQGTVVTGSDVDSCLGSVDYWTNTYSYNALSPCLLSFDSIDTNKTCATVPNCFSDLPKYSAKPYLQSDVQILGIAKDGHLIISNPSLDCMALDQCGGIMSQGSYVYVFNNRFPYTIDCYGPAMPRYYDAGKCSKNTCQQPFNGSIILVAWLAILISSFGYFM